MASADPWYQPELSHSGTSQRDRVVPALDPDHARIDERTPADLVAAARLLAGGIRYVGPDGRPDGVWTGFLPDSLPDDVIAAFLTDPDRFSVDRHPDLYRPHLTLLLAVLRMNGRVQERLNTLTGRHLDFHFRQVLGLTGRPAIPDRVNVVAELTRPAETALVPAGTRLSAGPDAEGINRIYTTDRSLLVTPASVGELRAVRVARDRVGLRQARAAHRNDPPQTIMALFQIALGRPDPGDPLPPYLDPAPTQVDHVLLEALAELVTFVENELHLRTDELREMVALKTRRDEAYDEWEAINEHLMAAADAAGNPLTIDDPRQFESNLAEALGGQLPDFAGVPEVETVYDAFELRARPEVQEAIRTELFFDDIDDFAEMMHLKVGIDREWRAINDTIEVAGARRRNDPSWVLPDGFEPTAFDTNLHTAIGVVQYPVHPTAGQLTTIEELVERIDELERYTSMTAAEFRFVVRSGNDPELADRADAILTQAYRGRLHKQRRDHLNEIRGQSGFDAMLAAVLSETGEASTDDLLARIGPYVASPAELELLERAATDQEVDWEQVSAVAEAAQSNREHYIEPDPTRDTWLNLVASDDATLGGADRWPLMGTPEPAAGSEPPDLGLVIASPLLALSGGERTIRLTLGFQAEEGADHELADVLSAEVSTEKGWVPVDSVLSPADRFARYRDLAPGGPGGTDGPEADLGAVQLEIGLDNSFDPVGPLPDDVPHRVTDRPAVRLVLRHRQGDDGPVLDYPKVEDLSLAAVHMDVLVEELTPTALANQDGSLDPEKPFEPFSRTPAVGSRLLIGHPELATKRLTLLRLRPEWMGLPDDLLTGYYRHYPDETPSFTVDVCLVDHRQQITLRPAVPLFQVDGTPAVLTVDDVAQASESQGHRHQPAPEAAATGDLPRWDRYVDLRLRAPDFQHRDHPRVASGRALQMAADIANGVSPIEPANYEVNLPYTPQLAAITLQYTASTELIGTGDPDKPVELELIHLHPFGHGPVVADGTGRMDLVPRYHNDGELYIGLDGVDLDPLAVSLLFQLWDGSGDPDVEPPTVEWSYADGGRWRTLPAAAVIGDTTRDLTTSGIVELVPPPAAPPTVMPGGRYWLRATVAQGAEALADGVSVLANGVGAVFNDHGNDPGHYRQPLPSESITGPVDPVPGLGRLHQPSPSTGGRPAEEPSAFATRVSERLRHKNRAITTWDYEHLVLEHFPQIYKAKCYRVAPGPDARAGTVDVVLIPDVRGTGAVGSQEPKVGPALREEVRELLLARSSPWVDLRIRNARYISVRIRLAVRFRRPGREQYDKRQLIDDLERHLSPWAYNEGADVEIGGKIYANSLIDFIDRRPYVDFAAGLTLFTNEDGHHFVPAPEPTGGEGYHVSAGRPDGVLRADRCHVIDVLLDSEYKEELRTGIGFMRVELDFRVSG